jgi:hypothetical protein
MGGSRKAYGATMKALRLVCALTFWALPSLPAHAESPVDFVKGEISREGARPWARVSYPDNHLEIEFDIAPYAASPGAIPSSFGQIVRQIVPEAFQKFPQLQAVDIVAKVSGTDKRGDGYDVAPTVAMVQFSRKNSASIRWDNVRAEDVVDIADHHSIDPALRR